MCVVSGVYDHYRDLFPKPNQDFVTITTDGVSPAVIPSQDLAELRKLIEEFKEAIAAAKVVDRLTGQPDCEDPEKAKLEARVAALEKELNRMKNSAKVGKPVAPKRKLKKK